MPHTSVYALPATAESRALLKTMFVDRDALRVCYQKLRKSLPRNGREWEMMTGLLPEKALFALRVL